MTHLMDGYPRLPEVTSAHHYPTCPSFILISPLWFIVLYQPITIPLAHLISSLWFITLYQPIAPPLVHPPIWFITSICQPITIPLTHPSIWYHHFDSLHYISPLCYAVHTTENLYCPDRVLCQCSHHLIPSSTLGHKVPLGALVKVLG